jgi:MSHA biogenesis protein MshQ
MQTRQFLLHWMRILATLFSLLSGPVLAATYTLPAACGMAATPFASCSLAGSNCNCGGNSVLIPSGNTVAVSSASTLRFTGTASFTLDYDVFAGTSGVAWTVQTASGTITLRDRTQIWGTMTSTGAGGNIAVSFDARVNGAISTAGGTIVLSDRVRVTGPISTSGSPGTITLGYDTIITGNISTTTGSIQINDRANITGNISTTSTPGNITMGYDSTINGNVSATNGTVLLNDRARINGDAAAPNINGNQGIITGNCSGDPTPAPSCGSTGTPLAVTTTAASTITASSATLNGSVTSSSSAVSAITFRYGTASNTYGAPVNATPSTLAANSTSAVSLALSGLVCGTTYFYRAAATVPAGTTQGAEMSFTTAACPSGFSAYETSVNNPAAATVANRIIKTRVAGTSANVCQANGTTCDLRVAAFLASNSVATSYAGTVTASLEYCTNVQRVGVGVASTVSCGGTWAALGAGQPVTLASGVGTVTFGFVNNAYEVVRVRISSATVPGGPWSSNDVFAIRPRSLEITATDTTSSTAGTTRSLTSGINAHKAMAPFTLNARALVAAGSTAGNYPGTGAGAVVKTVTTISPTGAGVVNGTLTLGAWSGTGTQTSSTATYTEVGTVAITLEDQDYANVDMADSTPAERYFTSAATGVGRFTPDHFVTSATAACGTSGFSYAGLMPTAVPVFPGLPGQAFGVQITPHNLSNTVTLNYAFTANTVTLSDATASSVGSFSNNTIVANTFNTTTGIGNAQPRYAFNIKATVPTTLVVRATDNDAISSTGFETAASTVLRSGRIRLQNAYGSERLALPVPLDIQHFTAQGWTAGADTCTALTASNFALTFVVDAANQLAACETALTASGSGASTTLSLSAPGANNAGWTQLTLNLGNTVVGSRCIAVGPSGGAETPANLRWLQFDWTGTGVPGNPGARANFGIYKSPLIYRRENY